MAEQSQITDLQRELMVAVEQLRACDRQLQLTKNQMAKADITIKEVEKNKPESKIYRSLGRMFIISNKDDLAQELKENVKQITNEQLRYQDLKKTYEAKRDHYVKQLNEIGQK